MFDLDYFFKFLNKKNFFVAGCDEVGRGPLAGPVVAACVCFSVKKFSKAEIVKLLTELSLLGIKDSKKLNNDKRRNILQQFDGLEHYVQSIFSELNIQNFTFNYSKNIQLIFSVQYLSSDEIDKINILNASLVSMRKAAIESCGDKGVVLIDGNKKFAKIGGNVELDSVIKGDSRSILIGLASIVAKEARDNHMKYLYEEFPVYEWNKNSGYPTKKHLEAIKIYGITKYHRKTFRGVKEFCI
jgi:ribonuclease HII